MDCEMLSVEDELFLFETFLKLSSPDYHDEMEVFFSEDENDIPLSEFFNYEKDSQQCPSPVDTISSPTVPQQFFPQTYPRSPSPCESPISLFPPITLDNLLNHCPTSPSMDLTPPPTPLPPQELKFSPQEQKFSPQELKFSPQKPKFSPQVFTPVPQPSYPPTPKDADTATVHFIDIKDLYEKAQVRRRGTSEQRLVDCRIHMVANFRTVPREVQVWVRRYTEMKGYQTMVQLPVIIERTMPNLQYFSVNLDSVYTTSLGKKFYQLSTTDRFRKNRFIINVSIFFEDNSVAKWKSEPFLIRSRKQSPNPRKPRSYSN